MKDLTINWYNSRSNSKGVVILSAQEYNDVKYELENAKQKLESLINNLEIYKSYDDIESYNPYLDWAKDQDMKFMMYQAEEILKYINKSSNILK